MKVVYKVTRVSSLNAGVSIITLTLLTFVNQQQSTADSLSFTDNRQNVVLMTQRDETSSYYNSSFHRVISSAHKKSEIDFLLSSVFYHCKLDFRLYWSDKTNEEPFPYIFLKYIFITRSWINKKRDDVIDRKLAALRSRDRREIDLRNHPCREVKPRPFACLRSAFISTQSLDSLPPLLVALLPASSPPPLFVSLCSVSVASMLLSAGAHTLLLRPVRSIVSGSDPQYPHTHTHTHTYTVDGCLSGDECAVGRSGH